MPLITHVDNVDDKAAIGILYLLVNVCTFGELGVHTGAHIL